MSHHAGALASAETRVAAGATIRHFEERHVWRTPDMQLAARVLERVTRAR